MTTERPSLPVTCLVYFLICGLAGCHSNSSYTAVAKRAPTQPAPGGGIQKIQRIVFLVKENRTFEHYFGTFSGADGATSGKISNGQTVPLTRSPDVGPYDLGHSWRDAIIAIDGGSMAKFDQLDSGYIDAYRYPYTQFLESDIPASVDVLGTAEGTSGSSQD